MKTMLRILLSSIKLVLASFWILFLCWNLFFGFWIAYLLLFFIVFLIKKFAWSSFSLKSMLLQFGIYILLLPFTLIQYQHNSMALYKKIADGKGLNVTEKLSIYGLNIVISGLAFPVYPEISKETFLMMFPATDGKRTFVNGFFLQSSRVSQAIRMDKKRVVWSLKDYALGHKEARYALALNPSSLTIVSNNQDIIYKLEVEIRYPESCEVMLVDYPIRVTLQEGLFSYLQEVGWLHPYHAIWFSDHPCKI